MVVFIKKNRRIVISSVKEEMVLSYESFLNHFTTNSIIIQEILYLKCQILLL
jgi:hypothetical protein